MRDQVGHVLADPGLPYEHRIRVNADTHNTLSLAGTVRKSTEHTIYGAQPVNRCG
jgi:hypothetical protein